jgi:folylpolyglutamate synthase/dihydropteroate synthase
MAPNILVDGAHNLDGIAALAKYIASIRDKFDHIELVVSLKDGKDPREMFAQLTPL